MSAFQLFCYSRTMKTCHQKLNLFIYCYYFSIYSIACKWWMTFFFVYVETFLLITHVDICCKKHVLIGYSDDGRLAVLIQTQLQYSIFQVQYHWIAAWTEDYLLWYCVAFNIQMTIISKRMSILWIIITIKWKNLMNISWRWNCAWRIIFPNILTRSESIDFNFSLVSINSQALISGNIIFWIVIKCRINTKQNVTIAGGTVLLGAAWNRKLFEIAWAFARWHRASKSILNVKHQKPLSWHFFAVSSNTINIYLK